MGSGLIQKTFIGVILSWVGISLAIHHVLQTLEEERRLHDESLAVLESLQNDLDETKEWLGDLKETTKDLREKLKAKEEEIQRRIIEANRRASPANDDPEVRELITGVSQGDSGRARESVQKYLSILREAHKRVKATTPARRAELTIALLVSAQDVSADTLVEQVDALESQIPTHSASALSRNVAIVLVGTEQHSGLRKAAALLGERVVVSVTHAAAPAETELVAHAAEYLRTRTRFAVLVDSAARVCTNAVNALWYVAHKADAIQPLFHSQHWSVVRVGKGLGGVIFQAGDLPALARFMRAYTGSASSGGKDAATPLVAAAAWASKKEPDAKTHFGKRKHLTFAYTLVSTVGAGACWSDLHRAMLSKKTYNKYAGKCGEHDLWPCPSEPHAEALSFAHAHLQSTALHTDDEGNSLTLKRGPWDDVALAQGPQVPPPAPPGGHHRHHAQRTRANRHMPSPTQRTANEHMRKMRHRRR